MYSSSGDGHQWAIVLFNWSSTPGSTGTGSKWMVYGQQFTPNGSPLGSAFLVNTTKAYDQKTPSVAINDEGNVVSVWAGGNVADNSGVLHAAVHHLLCGSRRSCR